MLNDPTATGQLRQPRGVVQVRTGIGAAASNLTGWLSFTVANNSYYEADTFHVELAVSALPDDMDAAWFSQQTELFVELFAGFPSDPTTPTTDDLDSQIFARVDDIEYDADGTTLSLTGRDLTGVFIDSKIADEYVNQTSSQVASALAAKHGITAQVTKTSAKVGTYYQIDQALLQANRSEWDLLCYLARHEGFVVFVSAQTLYFGPDPRDTSDTYGVVWTPADDDNGSPSANAVSLKFSRNMTVAKGISVVVRSTSLTGKNPIVQTYPTGPKQITAGKASPYGAVQTYYFTLAPGHSAIDCQQYAQKMYQQIASHAMKCKGEMPADNLLSVQVPLIVSGTGTDWDQKYFVMSVTRTLSMEEGYSMSFEAQNQTPDLEAAAAGAAESDGGATAADAP